MSWIGTVALEMKPGEDGRSWRTLAKLAYVSNVYGPCDGRLVVVLPGLLTDGASIPRLFWRLIGCPLRGRYAPAALIHDGLYAAQHLPRETADALFREMLLELGVGRAKAWAMYQAVRVGGGAAWRGHDPESVHQSKRYVEII